MKKFLPGLTLFVLVFSATVAIQVATATLSDTKDKKTGNEKIEFNFSNVVFETTTKKKIKINEIKTPLVIINFWATWCTPCIKEMPSMFQLKKKYSKDITVISVNTDDNNQIKNMTKTLKQLKINDEFEIVPDVGGVISTRFDLTAVPVTYIVKNGKLLKQYNGPVDFESAEFDEKVKKWIKN